MDRERIEALWERFLSGERLSPEEQRELLEAMSSSADLRTEFLEDEQIDRTLAAFGRTRSDADAFIRSFTHRLTLEEDKADFVRKVEARITGEDRRGEPIPHGGDRRDPGTRPRRPRVAEKAGRRLWKPLAAAALVLVGVLGVLLFTGREAIPPLARVDRVQGKVLLLPERIEVAAGQDVLPGKGLETLGPGSKAAMVYPDGTRLDLAGDTLLARVEAVNAGKRVSLSKGAIRATVAKQPSGRSMVITTPQGEATVLGTTLRIILDPDPHKGTRLEVEEGKVRLKNLAGRSIEVLSGHYAVAAAGVDLVPRTLAAASCSLRFLLHTEGPAPVIDANPFGGMRVRFSPDGGLLAGATRDDDLRVWDVKTGQLRRTVKAISPGAKSVAFADGGRILISGVEGDGGIRRWDVATGQRVGDVLVQEVKSLAVSPSGTLLAAVGYSVELWDLATGKRRTLEGLGDVIHSVAFSRDGRLVAAGGRQRLVKWWDVATGQERGSATLDVSHIVSVAFSPDGSVLAAAGGAGGVGPYLRFFDPATGQQRSIVREDSNLEVFAVSFSTDGRTFAAGYADGAVELWDVTTGAKLWTLREGRGPVLSLDFAGDGSGLATAHGDGSIRLWSVPAGVK